jgi:transposase-like protein
MDRKAFQIWLSEIDELTEGQKLDVADVLAGRAIGGASRAAIETAVGEDRCCPHCATPGAVGRGTARGLRRYRCNACGKSFNAVTATPLSGLWYRERWLDFGRSMADGDTVRAAAARCGIAVSTAFRWRHRWLKALKSGAGKLAGIVEADETFVLSSRKGERNLDRKPRKRGGKASKRGLSREQVPILVAVDRAGVTISAVLPSVSAASLQAALEPVLSKDALLVTDCCTSYPPCAAALGVSHEALNQTAGERVRGDLHIQTVNSRHERLKAFLRPRRGVATKYLASYLNWFHLAGLHDTTPRACLNAAMAA